MDILRQWAICITISSLVGAVVYALSPKGNIQRAMQVIISVFFLCAILSPFLNGQKIKFDFNDKEVMANKSENANNVELNKNVNEQMLDISKNMIEEQAKSILYSHQIYNGQIYPSMDIDDKGSIFIKAMTIKLPNNDMCKKNDIVDSICKQLGVESKIITIMETDDNEG